MSEIENTQDKSVENKLTMRVLAPLDTFTIMRILSLMKVKDVILTLFKRQRELTVLQQNNDGTLDQDAIDEVGMSVVAELLEVVMSNLYLAQTDINRLLASLCGVPVARIETLGFVEYNDLIFSFLEKRELKDFFTSLLSSKAFLNLR